VCCGAVEASEVARGRDFEYDSCDEEFSFVACAACGHHYLRDRPEPSELPRIYPPSYGNYQAGRSRALTFRVKNLLDGRWLRSLAREVGQPRALLDVGCADGRLLDLARRVLPELEQVEGVEVSEQAARAALDNGHRVHIGSIDEVELPAARYDLVFLQQVIEHVYEPARVCHKLRECLRPGGLAILETPTRESLDCRLFRRRYWGGYHFPRHFNLFSETSLRRLAEQQGLEWVRTHYQPQPVHWAWSLHHGMLERGWPEWTFRQLHIRNAPVMAFFTGVEVLAGLATRRMSNLQVVMRRPR